MSAVCSRSAYHAALKGACVYFSQLASKASLKLAASFLFLLSVFFVKAQGPVFNSTPVTTATVGQAYSYGASATEPSNKPLTMSVVSKPSWLNFSTNGQSTSTQFGTAVAQPGGAAGDAAGNIYVTNLSGTSPKVFKIAPDGTTTEWFTRRGGFVYAMLVHGDYLYLSYYSPSGHTDRITRVSIASSNPVEVTIAGTGTFSGPLSMVHKDGYLYVADWNASKIKKLRLSDNVISDVVTVSNVFGLGFAPNGLLYAAAYSQFKIYTFNLSNPNPQSTQTEKASLPGYTTDVKIDANGYVYVSGNGFVHKYTPDMSSFTTAWSGAGYVWGMSLTPGGALVFGLNSNNQVHKLQTGATLSGTPSINDIGVHAVSVKADNGTASTLQNFQVSVYGPSTFTANDLTKNQGDEPFTLVNPTSNSTGAFTYTSSNSTVATVSGNTVTIKGVGTTTITVTQAAAGLYLQTPKTFTLTVKPQAPVINSFTPVNGTTGTVVTITGAYFTGATGVSIGGKAVSSFTVVNSNQITAVVASGTPNGVISVTTAAGTGNSALIFSTVLPPVINTFAPASAKTGDVIIITGNNFTGATSVTINGLPAAFTIINGTTISAVVAATHATGPISVTTPFGNASSPAPLVVMKPAVIASLPALQKVYGELPFTLANPASNSTGAFTFSSSNTGVAIVVGNVVTIVGAGTTTITATQAADAQYLSGSVSTTLTVVKATPVLSGFTNLTKVYGSGAFELSTPKSNSPGTFSYTSSNSSVATVNQKMVTITGAGTTAITAVQAETANYKSGTITATLVVEKAVPAITGFAAITKTYGEAPFTVTAPSSNSTGAFTFSSSNTAVATVIGKTVTINGAGTTTLTATQAETANYKSSSVSAVLTVTKAQPTLSNFAAINKTYGEADFQLVAPVTNSTGNFTYSSSNTSVAVVNGNTVTIVGAGSAIITATQAADANYISGTISTTLNVAKAVPTIKNLPAIDKTFGDAPFTMSAPESTSPGAFSYLSSNTEVATIDGNTVTIKGAGTTTITVQQAATNNYESAQITVAVTVAKATPVVGSFESLTKTYGDAAFQLSAPTSTSTGAFTFTSSNTNVASINGTQVTINGAGNTTITATQAETANYKAASVTTTLNVAKADPVLSNFNAISKTYGDAAFVLAAPASNSTGGYTYTSTNTEVATIAGNKVTIRGAGTVSITATQAETANYNSATINTTLTVVPKVLTVQVANKIRCAQYDNPVFTYTITGFVNGENASALQTQPIATTTAVKASVAGNYAITASGATAANYTFNYITGNLQVANPEHAAQRMPTVDALLDESTPLQARNFGVSYQWSPATGLSITNSSRTQVRLQDEVEYKVAITEASGCVVVDTVKVRVFERPDVFVPTLFTPNGDGVNDVLRLNAVALKSLNYFRVYNQWGKVVFQTINLVEGWDGRFQGQLQPMATYTWVLSGIDKNGKVIRRSGSVTLAR